MRASVKIIACVYALFGATLVSQWVYDFLYIPEHRNFWGTSDLIIGLVPLGLAYGMVTFRPWARILGLVYAGLYGFVGVLSPIMWLVNVIRGFDWGSSGLTALIVARPVAGLIISALLIAFSTWQWWVLTRPQVVHLFSSKPA
jgi:hypothetical protein